MNDRIDRIKAHVRENKKSYIVGAAGVVVGALGVWTVSNQPKVSAAQRIIAFRADNATQNLTQITVLARRGHPGNVIKCNETGELFASQNRAAAMMGLDPAMLSKHLNGKKDHVGDYTFTNLGEAS